MSTSTSANELDALRNEIREHQRSDEKALKEQLGVLAAFPPDAQARMDELSLELDQKLAEDESPAEKIAAFMREFGISSPEGRALMALSESLLRIPDVVTAEELIYDQVFKGRTKDPRHNKLLAGILSFGKVGSQYAKSFEKSGDFLEEIRAAIAELCSLFIFEKDIDGALLRSKSADYARYRFTYDMLGESARTMTDADRYFESYKDAILSVGEGAPQEKLDSRPSISVKLSALHPRYEAAQKQRMLDELLPKLLELSIMAKKANLSFVIDGEESERLDLSLDILELLGSERAINGWDGLGLGVQAYQKRAIFVVDWLVASARKLKRQWAVRLVKGAYWDYEIKSAQERGLEGYTVFSDKGVTDLSYFACARKLIAHHEEVRAEFATHNTMTVAAIIELAGGPDKAKETIAFQCLHGMGEKLYRHIQDSDTFGIPCRLYAPVGNYHDLLPYLARRIVEYGAPSSFVHHRADSISTTYRHLTSTRVEKTRANAAETKIKLETMSVSSAGRVTPGGLVLPRHMYPDGRLAALGIDLSNPNEVFRVGSWLEKYAAKEFMASPIIDGKSYSDGVAKPIKDPADLDHVVGHVIDTRAIDIEKAISGAATAFRDWSETTVESRAIILERVADLLESRGDETISLCVYEAGKTILDSIADWREAVDFCRYYARLARATLAEPIRLPGATGECNEISLSGRGVFACISPWNFPIAIFTGQIAAALVSGNTVVAKPAEQTPLSANFVTKIFHEAGIPGPVLQLLTGDGPNVGAKIVEDSRISGVVFTGSVDVAQHINRSLASKKGPIVPFIAETGGLNAMIVDSTALPEQVVRDSLTSAFQSAGQRCSSLRMIFLQQEISRQVRDMLAGATTELKVGSPKNIDTDLGPLIDAEALDKVRSHQNRMNTLQSRVTQAKLPLAIPQGYYVAPAAYLLSDYRALDREIFGPCLHIVEYERARLDTVIDAINATGYALTAGIHSRIDTKIEYVSKRLSAGNIYVNRNTIGAVVGSQPFGGNGLSGTGPKAGGPNYLMRFCKEKVVTNDMTAIGGNTELMGKLLNL